MPACKISDGICQRCQDFIDAPPRQRLPDDIPLNWHTISALQSCSQCCKLCDFMLRIIHQELDPDRLAKLSTIQIYRNHEGRGNIVLLIPKKEPGGGLKHRELDSVVHGLIGKDTGPSTSHEATSGHTGSDETVSRIQTWLQACEQHIPCRQWREQYGEKFLPTRLLQVDHEVKLVDAAEVTDPRYAALSYCWGPKQGIQLLRSKIESHRQSIPFDDLPATFRDAINLVRRLGLRYIWIDALCIVQDNKQDWIAESPLMDQIYLHAHICIAATASDRSDKGLYRSRNPSLVRSVVVPTSTGAQTIFMNRQHWEVRKSPLSGRSWIIQERFMATRTVHFAGGQVFWECHQGCTSESFAPGSYEINLHFPDRKALQTETWHELAHDYTKGSLTYDTDRPVAISALSRLFSKALSSNYSHGMWEPHLRDDLTWQATHDGNPKRRSENVPTWSWLSINNASITWQKTKLIFDVALSGDALRLRARLCQIWLTFATKPNPNELNKKPLHIIFDAGSAHYAGHFFVDDLQSLEWLHESSVRRRSCYLMQACEGKTDIGIVLRNESVGKFTRLGQMAWNWGTLELEYRRSRPAPNAGDRFIGEAALVSGATTITAKPLLRLKCIANTSCTASFQKTSAIYQTQNNATHSHWHSSSLGSFMCVRRPASQEKGLTCPSGLDCL